MFMLTFSMYRLLFFHSTVHQVQKTSEWEADRKTGYRLNQYIN